MRRPPRVLVLLLAASASLVPYAPAVAQDGSLVRVGLAVELLPDTNEVSVSFTVEDPGPLIRLTLDLSGLANPPSRVDASAAWSQSGESYSAEFPGPRATMTFVLDSRVPAQTLEGEGFTSYVGPEFAVLRMGDLMPTLSFSFPERNPPSFEFSLDVDGPDAWSTAGPWTSTGPDRFVSDALPQGFLAAGRLAVVDYEADGTRVTAVRVSGAEEPPELAGVVAAGRSYLGALYGSTPDEFHLVVAPDPMYRGGLASPFGMFLHGDVDASVAAHELVHVHQGFQASRDPADATVWFLEGAAVLHGALLEVVAGLQDLEAAQEALERAHERAVQDPGQPGHAVYGSQTERAAYDQGALVLALLDRWVDERTGGSAGLGDVLRALNEDRAGVKLSNAMIVRAVENVTGASPTDLFDRYVWGSQVPDVVDVSPEQLVLRLIATEPSPPVRGPVSVVLEATNFGVAEVVLDEPVRLDGLPVGQVQANVPVGTTRTLQVALGELDAGGHALTIGSWRFSLDVLRPADPVFSARSFPPVPAQGDVLAVSVRIGNDGEAPWKGTLRLEVDGVEVDRTNVTVDGGRTGLANLATVLQRDGPVNVVVRGPAGETVWSANYDVSAPRNAGVPGAAAIVGLLTLLAIGARWRRRS